MHSPYSSMSEYDSSNQWGSMDSDYMYPGRGYMQQMQQPVEKYPPSYVVLRSDQYENQKVEHPSIAWHGLDMSGGLFTKIPPSIGNFTHLTSLYLLNNKLSTLPSRIFTGLVNLTFLDISNNQLTKLPAEIESAQQLQKLLLSNNNLTSLPVEMGRLWRLKTLSLDGNRITEPSQQIIQQGTQKIISYLRDNVPPISPLPARAWKAAQLEQTPGPLKFKIFTYNVLAESYATEEQHPYTPTQVLQWETRKYKILEQILESGADLICLQEVEAKQFQYFFVPQLQKKGFEGIHKLKTRAKTMNDPSSVDGCSIFYRSSKFRLEQKIELEYQSLAIHNNIPTGPGLDRTIRRDNIALAAILQIIPEKTRSSKMGQRRILLCNTHIHWDPSEADVKLMQVQFMLRELDAITKQKNEPNMPLLIAGDFNSEPTNAVFSLLKTGKVDPSHVDWNGTNYGHFSREGCSHRFRLQNSFEGICEPEFTNFNGDFMGVLDYIWYTCDSIRIIGVADTPTKEEILTQKSPLPNSNYPSDHIYLLAEFEVLSNKRRGN